MDSCIKRYDAVQDGDLMLCESRGLAYQKDMRHRVQYSDAYLQKLKGYEGSDISNTMLEGRCSMLTKLLKAKASVLDYGAGSGAFVRAARARGFDVKGYDILPAAALELKASNLWSDDIYAFDCLTMWDTLEHLDRPDIRLKSVKKFNYLFVSLPLFDSLATIRLSKHYRPGEHLYYWTRKGFLDWIALYGFRMVESSDHEVRAGRESIEAFAFCRDLPDYHDYLGLYDKKHSTQHYGSSATELHLDTIAGLVKQIGPKSILDFGCGRSDLVAHFWMDGARRIARYDPAIPNYKDMPQGQFDLVLCCDVMEHIPMSSVDRILSEIKEKGRTVIFTISTKLARAKLPDGQNAHVTLLSASEWTRWIADYFGRVDLFPTQWPHELVVAAGMKR